jgi:hypothetical protein
MAKREGVERQESIPIADGPTGHYVRIQYISSKMSSELLFQQPILYGEFGK